MGEKLGNAVEAAHRIYRLIDDAGAPRHDPLRAAAYETFHYVTTAFLALYNMLGLLASPEKIDGSWRSTSGPSRNGGTI